MKHWCVVGVPKKCRQILITTMGRGKRDSKGKKKTYAFFLLSFLFFPLFSQQSRGEGGRLTISLLLLVFSLCFVFKLFYSNLKWVSKVIESEESIIKVNSKELKLHYLGLSVLFSLRWVG